MPQAHMDLIDRVGAKLSINDISTPPAAVSPRRVPAFETKSFTPPVAPPAFVHRLDRSQTINWSGTRTPIMEEIRLIKRRLLSRAFGSERGDARLIMITSAKPGEGKTFTSTNLAMCMSLEEDYDVVLVDADIHRQSLCRNLGIPAARGLVDLALDRDLALADVLLRTDIPRLSILPAGIMNERAPELLAGARMRAIIDDLVTHYPDRVIVFDAPPCLVSSDAATLASHVGQAVVVVEANQTQLHEVSSALQLISACPDISLVLNKAGSGGSTSYGAYGAY